jgi:hypothetical protein
MKKIIGLKLLVVAVCFAAILGIDCLFAVWLRAIFNWFSVQQSFMRCLSIAVFINLILNFNLHYSANRKKK